MRRAAASAIALAVLSNPVQADAAGVRVLDARGNVIHEANIPTLPAGLPPGTLLVDQSQLPTVHYMVVDVSAHWNRSTVSHGYVITRLLPEEVGEQRLPVTRLRYLRRYGWVR